MDTNASLKLVVEKLEKMFQIFNDKFYDGKLQTPVIAVNADNAGGALGWCSVQRCWKKEGTDGYHEINITAEYLTRPFKDVCATMLHELVHLWNIQNDVKDTSRGFSYHNKTFKLVAEEHGLLIDKDEKHGWTKTSLQEDTKTFIDTTWGTETGFELYRTGGLRTGTETAKGKSKSSSRKYVCPMCQTIIRATKEVNVRCGDCNVDFEEED